MRDFATIDFQVGAVKDTDSAYFTVSARRCICFALGDLAAVHHHRGAVSQCNVTCAALHGRGRVLHAVIIGDRSTIHSEFRFFALRRDSTLIEATQLPRTSNGAGVHH